MKKFHINWSRWKELYFVFWASVVLGLCAVSTIYNGIKVDSLKETILAGSCQYLVETTTHWTGDKTPDVEIDPVPYRTMAAAMKSADSAGFTGRIDCLECVGIDSVELSIIIDCYKSSERVPYAVISKKVTTDAAE